MRARGSIAIAAAIVAFGCGGSESSATTDGGSDGGSSSADTGVDSTSPDTAIPTDGDVADDGGDAIDDARPDGSADADAEAEADADECGGITYAGDIQGIWNLHCAVPGCHIGAAAPSPDLSPGKSWSDIVGVPSGEMPSIPYVKPGDPTNSWLYEKVTSGHPPGAALTAAERNDILQWILCGAPP